MDPKKNRVLEERRSDADRRSGPRHDHMPDRRREGRGGGDGAGRRPRKSPAIWYDKPADWI